MRMNKKALIFSISLVLLVLGALIAGFIFVQKLKNQTSKYAALGESSKSILEGFMKSQEVLVYTDSLAAFSLYSAIEQAAKDAGINPDKTCGSIQGQDETNYVIWNKKENDKNIKCYRQQTFDQYFTELFQHKLNIQLLTSNNQLLKDYRGNHDIFIKLNSLISENKNIQHEIIPTTVIYGIANKPINIPLTLQSGQTPGDYYFRPSFTIHTNYDLTIYDKLYGLADEIINNCQKSKEQKLDCIKTTIDHFNANNPTLYPTSYFAIDDNTFAFQTKPKTYFNPYESKPHPLIKFAIKF